jgi:hypothetical protein
MSDFTPTQAEVERIVDRDFPAPDRATILGLLDEYGRASWQRQSHRVRLAILKLAAGRTDEVVTHLVAAQTDYRDVLGWAESPRAMAAGAGAGTDADSRADRAQYDAWLRGG